MCDGARRRDWLRCSRLGTGPTTGTGSYGERLGLHQSGTRLPPPPPLPAILSLELDGICALSFGPADAATAARARAVTTIASASVILLNMVSSLRAICFDGRFLAHITKERRISASPVRMRLGGAGSFFGMAAMAQSKSDALILVGRNNQDLLVACSARSS